MFFRTVGFFTLLFFYIFRTGVHKLFMGIYPLIIFLFFFTGKSTIKLELVSAIVDFYISFLIFTWEELIDIRQHMPMSVS